MVMRWMLRLFNSLSTVLCASFFRKRIQSVADSLKGKRQHGFFLGKWEALQLGGGLPPEPMRTCSFLGALGQLGSLDLHGFYKWVF